jgi:hypothetical protein
MSRWAIDRCFNRIFRSSFNEANCCLQVSSSLRICRKLSSISSSFIPPNTFPRRGRKFKNYLTFRAQRKAGKEATEGLDLPQRHRGHGISVNRKTDHLSTGSSAVILLHFQPRGQPPANEMGSFVFGTKRITDLTFFNLCLRVTGSESAT